MKKHAICVISLVLAAFVFGSCDSGSGGTIKVKNASNTLAVYIYITNVTNSGSETTPPTEGVVADKRIESGETGDILIAEDGLYYIKPFFINKENELLDDGNVIPEVVEAGTADKTMVYLMGGDTESVTVKQK